MEIIVEQYAEQLKKQPYLLNEVTQNLLRELAKEHHPHNQLLPAEAVQILLVHYSPQSLLGTGSHFQKYILSINCLRNILVANFRDLSDNKMYNTILMNYTLSLGKLIQKQRESIQEDYSISLQMIARSFMLNQVMIKLLIRTRTYLPQYFRSVKISLEVLQTILPNFQDQLDEKQMKKCSKVQQQISKLPTILYRLGIKKEWKKQMMIVLINAIKDQFQSYVKAGGLRKLMINIKINEQILELLKTLRQGLPQDEQKYIGQAREELKSEETDAVYLQQPLKTKELTPRFYNEEQSFIINKLRKKKSKLQKRMENDLRKSVLVKQQESHVIDDVRRQKSSRQQKKQGLIMEKQTSQAKKYAKQMQKVNKIKKISKGSRSEGKGGRGGIRGRGGRGGRGSRK